jgi:hypothetical protein
MDESQNDRLIARSGALISVAMERRLSYSVRQAANCGSPNAPSSRAMTRILDAVSIVIAPLLQHLEKPTTDGGFQSIWPISKSSQSLHW